MMECKQALNECAGDLAKATEWLRKKYKGKLAERAGRSTGEGRIGVYLDPTRKFGGIVELQCETAPVAKNEMFVELANAFAKKVALGKEASPNLEVLRKDPELDHRFTEVFGRLRETMNLMQARQLTGNYLSSYVHHDGKSGIIIALDAEPKSTKNIGADLCMHALFSKPIAVDRKGVSAAELERVRTEARDIVHADEKNKSKPKEIVEKIINNRVEDFFAQRVLVEQLHVKTDDYGKRKVGDILKEAGVNAVTGMTLMLVGGA